jgi:CBS-domain-containing membrane protein
MRPWLVADVMTEAVVAVGPDVGYDEIVEELTRRRVSAVPVVDRERRVVGVVSEADLLSHAPALEQRRPRPWRRQVNRGGQTACTAAELMTSPAVSIRPHATVADAHRLMDDARIKRLPVVDGHGRLVGIVSRGDLLRVHLRQPEAIRREIEDVVLLRTLGIDPSAVRVQVDRGVVTLRGLVCRSSTIALIERMCRDVSGVVDVVNEIAADRDDVMTHRPSRAGGPSPGRPGSAPPRSRGMSRAGAGG